MSLDKASLPKNKPVVTVERHAQHVGLHVTERVVTRKYDLVSRDGLRFTPGDARMVGQALIDTANEIDGFAIACGIPELLG